MLRRRRSTLRASRLARLKDSNPFLSSPQPHELAAAFVDEWHWPGAHGLTNAEKASLKAIREPLSAACAKAVTGVQVQRRAHFPSS
jgi:hypothetical protein